MYAYHKTQTMMAAMLKENGMKIKLASDGQFDSPVSYGFAGIRNGLYWGESSKGRLDLLCRESSRSLASLIV